MKYTLILLFVSISLFSVGQELTTKNKKAREYYLEADNYRVRGQYNYARELLNKAISKDSDFAEAYYLLGQIADRVGDRGGALSNYFTAFQLLEDKKRLPLLNYELAKTFFQKGDLEKAEGHSKLYLEGKKDINKEVEINKLLIDLNYTRENPPGSSEISPIVLPTINRFPMQYFPVITADNSTLIFTKRGPQIDEDIYVSINENGTWSTPFSISNNINTQANEGTCTISTDMKVLIFTSCQARGGYGSCDLYISERKGNQWTYPVNLGPVLNSPFWDSQPSLSANGNELFFISERPGGIGGKDIWYTKRGEDENWISPINLGHGVNTPLDEVAPFLHANGKELFFSSNGYPGYGGFDIFKVEKTDEMEWTKPTNLGHPINTAIDQVGLTISADGTKGYYSVENQSSYGLNSQIIEFNVPLANKTKYEVSYVFGIVTDSETKKPLKSKIELYNIDTDTKLASVHSDSVYGDYKMVLTEGAKYAVFVSRDNYLFESLTFNYSNDLKPIEVNVELKKIKEGNTVVLRNIFFETASYSLNNESKTELNKLIKFLIQNPSIKISINGYTDDVGDENDNQLLSLNRAKSVYRYIINNGINSDRLTYNGFGETQPIIENNSDENRAKNRRIEFKID